MNKFTNKQRIAMFSVLILVAFVIFLLLINNEPQTEIPQALKQLNVYVSINEDSDTRIGTLASLIGSDFDGGTIETYVLKEVSDSENRYAKKYLLDNDYLKVYRSGTLKPFSVIVNKNTNRIVQIALGSDLHGWLNMDAESFHSLSTIINTELSTAKEGEKILMQEVFYPEMGLDLYYINQAGNMKVVAINLVSPIAKDVFSKDTDLKLFRLFSFR